MLAKRNFFHTVCELVNLLLSPKFRLHRLTANAYPVFYCSLISRFWSSKFLDQACADFFSSITYKFRQSRLLALAYADYFPTVTFKNLEKVLQDHRNRFLQAHQVCFNVNR